MDGQHGKYTEATGPKNKGRASAAVWRIQLFLSGDMDPDQIHNTVQLRHKHSVWSWTCNMDIDIQYGHWHATRRRTCSTERDMLHQHGYAAIDMALWHWPTVVIQHQHGNAALTWTCSINVDMQHSKINCKNKVINIVKWISQIYF